MKRFLLLLTAIVASIGLATAQTRVVRGTVTSLEDGEPVIGASVIVKGSPTIGVNTDVDGKFTLDVPSNATHLIVSFVGKRTQEVAISKGEMKIVLADDAQVLDEVVVTGYQTTSKKAFTGAASAVGGETVKAKFDANPVNALKGNIPGLQLSQVSGQPGAPSTIFVRGRNSLNSGTQPLYVIDGVPIEAGVFGIRASEGVEISPLATLSSDDIANITVLKDAAATSIYGARAANGVIVITTKRGHGGFKANFNARIGGAMLPAYTRNYRGVDGNTWLALSREAVRNSANYKDPNGSVFNQYHDSYPDWDINNDTHLNQWLSEFWYEIPFDAEKPVFYDWLGATTRTGLQQNYGLDISGGGDAPTSPRYFVAFDYMSDQGIVIGKDLNRYALRVNINQNPYAWLGYGINTSLSLTTTNMGSGGGYFADPLTASLMQTPVTPIYNPDGSFNTSTVTNGVNPVAARSKNGDKNTQKQYRALISPYITLNFTDWLSFTSRLGLDAYILDDFGFWSLLGPDGKNYNGHGENGTIYNFYTTITNTFNINKAWNDHTINFLIGQEGQRTNYKSTYLEATNFAVDYLNDIALAATPSTTSSIRDELKLLSFLSNFEYNYAERYYASASLRADASSRFHKSNRWGMFWSLGGKWRMANEAFMESSRDWLQDLTLRISYGTSGNQAVGSGWYAASGLFDFGYLYNNQPGSLFTQFENPNLKWEQTAKLNVGVDFRVLDRISLGFDYYNHQTRDMVFAVPLSKSTGLPTYYDGVAYYENLGALENQGIEFELGIDAVRTKDAQLRFTFTGSHNRNRIKKLATDLPIKYSAQIIKVGEDISTFYLREYAGVDPETGMAQWYKNTEKEDGTLDRSLTSNYNDAEQTILGKATPDFQGGFRTDFNYKDFDFSFLLTYQFGGKIYGNHLQYDETTALTGSNFTNWVADNRWQKPGDKDKLVPMFTEQSNSATNPSSRFLMSSNYLKIQNVQIGYTFKQKELKTIGLSSIRLFLTADNLYTFVAKNYRGFDPASVGANGIAWWNYPQATKVMGGVSFSF